MAGENCSKINTILLVINTVLLAVLVFGMVFCPAMKPGYCPLKNKAMCPYTKGSGTMDMKGSMQQMPVQDSGAMQQ